MGRFWVDGARQRALRLTTGQSIITKRKRQLRTRPTQSSQHRQRHLAPSNRAKECGLDEVFSFLAVFETLAKLVGLACTAPTSTCAISIRDQIDLGLCRDFFERMYRALLSALSADQKSTVQ